MTSEPVVAGGPSATRSPWAFFALTALFFAPFPLLATVVHVPGMPKNAPVTDFVGAFAPAAAALVLTWRRDGPAAARRLLGRVVDGRRIRHPAWWVPALLLPVAALAVTATLTALTGVHFQRQPALPLVVTLVFVPVFLLAAAGEELGWSGYVTEPLRDRFGALGGAAVLGLIWWAFHVPSILQSGQRLPLVLLGVVMTVALRVLYVWLFLGSGSVTALVVVHAVSNLCASYVPTLPTSANAPAYVAFAIVVVVVAGPGLVGSRGRVRPRVQVPGRSRSSR